MDFEIGRRIAVPRARARRLATVLALVTALLVGLSSAAIGQDATPPAATPVASPDATPASTPAANVPRQELAAMAISPQDVGADYGIVSAQYVSPGDVAAQFAAPLGVSADEALQRLQAEGFVSLYNMTIARPIDPANASAGAARIVSSFIYQYANSSGGKTGYELLGEAWGQSSYEAVEGTTRFGNATQIVRVSQSNGADQRLLLSFRVHELVVGVVIQDGTGTAPTVAEIEPLARTLRAHMRDVQEGRGPDLAASTLRIVNPSGSFRLTTSEYYDRMGGATTRRFTDTDQIIALRQAGQGSATDVYTTAQMVQRAEGGENAPYAIVTAATLRFADAAAATEFLTTGVQPYLGALGVAEASIVPDVPVFGDSSLAVTYQITYAGGVSMTGYAYFVQIGDQAAIIQAEAPAGVDRAAVETLVQRQVDCLSQESCRSAPVPKGLVAK